MPIVLKFNRNQTGEFHQHLFHILSWLEKLTVNRQPRQATPAKPACETTSWVSIHSNEPYQMAVMVNEMLQLFFTQHKTILSRLQTANSRKSTYSQVGSDEGVLELGVLAGVEAVHAGETCNTCQKMKGQRLWHTGRADDDREKLLQSRVQIPPGAGLFSSLFYQ